MSKPKSMPILWKYIAAVTMMVLAASAANIYAQKPVKVFILAGQSNMEGHGHVKWGLNPERSKEWAQENSGERHYAGGVGSLRYEVNTDPDKYGWLVDKEGDWVVRDDVYLTWNRDEKGRKDGWLTIGFGGTSDGETIGPELGFGFVVGDALDAPVLLIKEAWGGKSLAKDFRPPSAVEKRGGSVGQYYKTMVEHIKNTLSNLPKYTPWEKGRDYEIAGFGWHQGWNDGCNADATKEYEKNMADFIRDVRDDLDAPAMPFVIASSGFGGMEHCKGRRLDLVKAQLAMCDAKKYPEFKNNVACVDTRPFNRSRIPAFGQGYHWHWNGETHYLIGEAMGEAIVELVERE